MAKALPPQVYTITHGGGKIFENNEKIKFKFNSLMSKKIPTLGSGVYDIQFDLELTEDDTCILRFNVCKNEEIITSGFFIDFENIEVFYNNTMIEL